MVKTHMKSIIGHHRSSAICKPEALRTSRMARTRGWGRARASGRRPEAGGQLCSAAARGWGPSALARDETRLAQAGPVGPGVRTRRLAVLLLLVSGQLLAVFLYLGFFPPCIFIKQTRQSPEWSHHLFPDSPDEPIMRTAYWKNVLQVVGNHNAVCFLHVQMR